MNAAVAKASPPMMKRHPLTLCLSRTVSIALTALALGPVAAQAQSVGVYRGVFDAREASLASAGSVLGGSPVSALAWNPAALAWTESPEASAAVAAASASGHFTNRVDASGRLEDAFGLVPDGALAVPIHGYPIVVAGGLLTEGAIAGSWHYRDAPGVAGATYGLETHRSGVLVLRPTAGVGIRLGNVASIGGSVSMLWNRNELQAPYIFQSQAPLVGLKTLLDVHATGTGFNATLGAMVKPHDRLSAALSWRSGTTLTTHGTATGDAWAQFEALGVDADASFTYDAAVRNRFPSMIAAGAVFQATDRLSLTGQVERWGWRDAFSSLPITLTDGTNAVVNGLVGSSTIQENVPLAWDDQVVRRMGAEYAWSPTLMLRGGYAYSPSPVPTGTLTPMTAAIVEHTVGVGAGLVQGRTRIDLGLQWSPAADRFVTNTDLKGSEYNASGVSVGTRALVVSVTRRF
jgi:long-subunit fatty acid transport protein